MSKDSFAIAFEGTMRTVTVAHVALLLCVDGIMLMYSFLSTLRMTH